MENSSLNFMNTILVEDQPRNKFDLSHRKMMSMDMGELIPSKIIEVIPGDRMESATGFRIDFAPMIAPVKQGFKAYIHDFFVPARILTAAKVWDKFITQANAKKGLPNPVLPFINLSDTAINPGSWGDYMGIPTTNFTGQFPAGKYPNVDIKINALIPAAILKIYDDYYRDQDLIDPILPEDGLPEGDNTALLLPYLTGKPLKRARKLDYFTAARPWPQGNIEQVTMPITGRADIEFDDSQFGTEFVTIIKDALSDGMPNVNDDGALRATDGAARFAGVDPADDAFVAFDNSAVLKANLTNAVTTTINDFRKAMAFQQYYELNGRAGTRLPEWTWAHFGVKTDDASLQRPQYLGGGAENVVIQDVTQTSGTPSDDEAMTPLGQKAGEGWAIGKTSDVDKEFTEHGFVISMMTVMPEVTYMQGLQKMWTRFDPFDYYVPSLAEIGEQPVLTKELYFTGNTTVDEDGTITGGDDEVYGYLPAWSEYRTMLNQVNGDFRDTLLYFHLADIYEEQPILGKDFIEQGSSETKRIFAVQDLPVGGTPEPSGEPTRNWNVLYVEVHNTVMMSRKIPMFGEPAKIV